MQQGFTKERSRGKREIETVTQVEKFNLDRKTILAKEWKHDEYTCMNIGK